MRDGDRGDLGSVVVVDSAVDGECCSRWGCGAAVGVGPVLQRVACVGRDGVRASYDCTGDGAVICPCSVFGCARSSSGALSAEVTLTAVDREPEADTFDTKGVVGID